MHEGHELKWKKKIKVPSCLVYLMEIELSWEAHHEVKRSVPYTGRKNGFTLKNKER